MASKGGEGGEKMGKINQRKHSQLLDEICISPLYFKG